VKKYVPILKNRYLVSSLAVLIYILVMHDTDVYTLWKRQQKVASLEAEIDRRQTEIAVLKEDLAALQDLRSLEKYARETHYFKKDDEELFIFSFE
jgi:cell division protein DivIC